MNKPILNIADVDLVPRPVQFAPTGPAADKFEVRTAQLSQQLGAQKLGYGVSRGYGTGGRTSGCSSTSEFHPMRHDVRQSVANLMLGKGSGLSARKTLNEP